MSNINHFSKARTASRSSRHRSITGLFWQQPELQQQARIRELARQFTVETISTIVRRSAAVVARIVEGTA